MLKIFSARLYRIKKNKIKEVFLWRANRDDQRRTWLFAVSGDSFGRFPLKTQLRPHFVVRDPIQLDNCNKFNYRIIF